MSDICSTEFLENWLAARPAGAVVSHGRLPLGEQVGELLEDKVDTKLSFSKIFWTIVCLSAIFGKKGRKKGFTLGKLFAGIGLFNMWKKK